MRVGGSVLVSLAAGHASEHDAVSRAVGARRIGRGTRERNEWGPGGQRETGTRAEGATAAVAGTETPGS